MLSVGFPIPPASHASSPSKPLSFVNDIAPVLTKSGCNTGVCHAKAGGGQNGFQLSLLGFEPEEDFRHLVFEGRGRRLFLSDPQRSLLLAKASGEVPHGGGVRLAKDSEGYKLLEEWIRQGTPFTKSDEPVLTSLEVTPAKGKLERGKSVQLNSMAHFSDGSSRDVTSMALYESNDSGMVQVNDVGLVKALDVPGKSSVMVRYQGKVAVYSAAIPLGVAVDELPVSRNFIDDLVFANLKDIGIPPSPVCDDSTFLRRVSLDIGGRLPTIEESREFIASSSENKRREAIERLLRSPDYADFFANKWTAVLKNRRDSVNDITSNFAFHAWIRDSLLANTSYDQLARELLAATGTVVANPPVAWYKRVKEPKQQIEDVAQLFLGVRMQCAQCHHHPFERWSQEDYYGLAAFFGQVGRKPTDTQGEDLIFHKRGVAVATNMKTGKPVKPIALGDSVGEIPPDEDPRLRLANWMSSESNPFFAKALVNRYWKHFFKRGLVEPEDDIRDTNPPTNPELLDALANHFISSSFDLKELIRVITNSVAYQLSTVPNEHNVSDRQNYSRYYPKRLQAEVMLDSIDYVTGSTTSFANLPIGTRAVALPDNSYNAASPFLRLFGRPEASSVCECERVQSGSLAQSLHLMNASDIRTKLSSAKGRASELATAESSAEDKIREVYLAAFSRVPTSEELKIAKTYLEEKRIDKSGKPKSVDAAMKENMQDLLWAVINTKEFMFNH